MKNRATRTTRYTLTLLRAVLALMWLTTGAAGALVLTAKGGVTLDVDPVLLVLSTIVSLLSGGTTLLIRVNNLLIAEAKKADEVPGYVPRPLVRPWLFVSAHMAGSVLAGLAMFIITRQQSVGPWESLAGVLLASFIGATFLERMAEKLPILRV
jgi:hypothetical protein